MKNKEINTPSEIEQKEPLYWLNKMANISKHVLEDHKKTNSLYSYSKKTISKKRLKE
jgi:hypothetical protein